jgi:hypothetical protein
MYFYDSQILETIIKIIYAQFLLRIRLVASFKPFPISDVLSTALIDRGIAITIFGCGIVVSHIIIAGTAAHTIIVRIINMTAVIFSAM